jgi:RNA:NAD 2'-phosphotransferase (TPT1/KptA family)
VAIDGGKSALAEDAKLHQTLYHGTSSNYISHILKHGIKADSHGNTYVSTDPELATREAYNTTHGEIGLGTKKAHGGDPVLVHIDRNHPSVKGFKKDPEYSHSDDERKSFMTTSSIHPKAIKKITSINTPRPPIE